MPHLLRIDFSVPGEPMAKGRPRATVRRRGGKVWAGTYTPAQTALAENLFAARCMDHRPPAPLAGPVRVAMTFAFGVPASWPGWKAIAAVEGTYHHVGSKDVDNLAKLALDAMNGVFFLDDRQVVELQLRKCYAAIPQTIVTIEELPQAERAGKAVA